MPTRKHYIVLINKAGERVHTIKKGNQIDTSRGYGFFNGEWYEYDRNEVLETYKHMIFSVIKEASYGKLRAENDAKCTIDEGLIPITIKEGIGK